MKKTTIIIIMTAMLHLSLSAQIIPPLPLRIASTQHISGFQDDGTICNIVRAYNDSTIVSCFYSIYENSVQLTPTSQFAIIDYNLSPSTTHWYFSLPGHHYVTDMEILDTMCYFCGFCTSNYENDSTAFVGQFSIEELIRHGTTCSCDIANFTEYVFFSKIAATHVRNNKDLVSLAVIGYSIAFTESTRSSYYATSLVLMGNYDMYNNAGGWRYSMLTPNSNYDLQFKDVLSINDDIYASTTYNDRNDAIAVVTTDVTRLNVSGVTGLISPLTLSNGDVFHISEPIVICKDPVTNSNIQLFASLTDHECGYGLYATNFSPGGHPYVYTNTYINTGYRLTSALEAVGLPWSHSFFVTALQHGTGLYQVYRLPYSFISDTVGKYLYCERTTNKSIDRINDSTIVTGGEKRLDSSIKRHSVMSQNEAYYNDLIRTCYRREHTYYVRRGQHEDYSVKDPLYSLTMEQFFGEPHVTNVRSDETTRECLHTNLKTLEHCTCN